MIWLIAIGLIAIGLIALALTLTYSSSVLLGRVRAVGEIGLDSLMALEFAMNLEDSFGIHVTLTSAIGDLTVAGLANEIILQLDLGPTREYIMAKNIAEKHFEKPEPRQLSLLEEIAGDVATRRKGTLA